MKNKDDPPDDAAELRKRTEEALRESEERYQRITEATTDYIYTVRVADRRAAETTHGPGCLAVTGYRAQEFVEDPFLWVRMVAAEDRPGVEEQARRILAGEDAPPIEHRIVHKNRTVRWVRNTFVPHRDEHGALVSYDGLIQNITERKRTEEALRKSEMQLRATLESTADGILAVDNKGKVLHASMRFIELWQIPQSILELEDDQAMLNFVLSQLTDPDAFLKKVQLLYGSDAVDMDTIAFKDGRFFERYSIPMNMDGVRMGRVWSFRDITERKRAEKEKDALQAQLLQAQKMEAVALLAGGVAHDFNNMLSAILGHAELAMMRCTPSDPIHADLKVIEKSALRSADLVRQLLAFARRQPVAPKVLDLNDSVTGMLKMLLRLIGEDIDLVWVPGAGLWPVKIDPSQIDQLLANLCVNARDAIAGVGKVTIETENTAFDEAYCAVHPGFICGEYVMLAVSDDGCGLNKDVLDHLFEPFFTTKELGKGTGLGLPTVYGIVKQNEGFINVYSEPDQGTTFKIYLPRFVGEAVEPMAESTAETPKGRGETVLLVEDEAMILDVGRAMLERLGYTVLTADTPGEALRQAKVHASEIQLLITDVVMPEMNGRDLAKLIRDIKPGLKCLFTSGYTANVIAHSGVLEEGVNFLQKPISMTDLASKVRQVLER